MSKENWCSCHDSLVCGNCSAKKDKRISELEAQLEALQSSKTSVDPHVNPECDHNGNNKAHWDYVHCLDCGWVLQGKLSNTGDRQKDGHREWWPSRSHAEFFYKHGRYLSEQKAD